MRTFKQLRTRILVATQHTEISSQLITLLSGQRILVDAVKDLSGGIRSFRQFKHPIIIIDEELIPASVARLLTFFQYLQKDCLVVVLTRSSKNIQELGLFVGGVFDVIALPLVREEVSFRIKRMIRHHRLMGNNQFLGLLVLIGILLIPPLLLLFYDLFKASP